MDINMILRILQDAREDIELVEVARGTWRAEYVQVLKAFAALDDWISQGNPLPEVWAAHRSASQQPAGERLLPRPRKEPDL